MADASPFETVLGFYPVRDLSATRDFYERDLGLRVARDQGVCLIFAAGGGYVGFCQREPAEGREAPLSELGDGPIITFVTPDVEGWYQRVRRLGVETDAPPRRNERFAIVHFFARDPDGYRVEIQRFEQPLR